MKTFRLIVLLLLIPSVILAQERDSIDRLQQQYQNIKTDLSLINKCFSASCNQDERRKALWAAGRVTAKMVVLMYGINFLVTTGVLVGAEVLYQGSRLRVKSELRQAGLRIKNSYAQDLKKKFPGIMTEVTSSGIIVTLTPQTNKKEVLEYITKEYPALMISPFVVKDSDGAVLLDTRKKGKE